MTGRAKFWIDRGGTFTDCIGLFPDGRLRATKVLSSDEAPLLAIRQLLGLGAAEPIPACDVRMGTTLATNALLERHGVDTLLIITRGFADLLLIGDQTRSDLFALDIHKPTPLPVAYVETSARRAADGSLVQDVDLAALRPELSALCARGVRSAAVVVMHDHVEGKLEQPIVALLNELGFEHVSASHEVSAELGLLARTETTTVDAYLTPLLRAYLERMRDALPESRVRMMQSSGGLTDATRFRGRDAVLSGPAGGVVALAEVARRAREAQVIGFDMGGTSTDVSRYAGELERTYEAYVAGVRLRTPMMDIHTIAAGGGSLCRFDGRKLSVGPESAGARPGPLCYGAAEARELALTDVHLALGRLVDDRFPFRLSRERVDAALDALAQAVCPEQHDPELARMRVAEGFFRIAVESMAEAIRRVTVARGHDVRKHALVVFGGAGGQAACAVAQKLGIRRLLFHPLAGVLSAFGMGVASDTVHRERDLHAEPLSPHALSQAMRVLDELALEARSVLVAEGAVDRRIRIVRRLDLRYAGTETSLSLPLCAEAELREAFHAAHAQAFGYARAAHPLELVVARIEAEHASEQAEVLPALEAQTGPVVPLRMHRLYTDGAFVEDVPVYERTSLGASATLFGPCLVLDDTGTLVIEAGFVGRLGRDGVLTLEDQATVRTERAATERDPVLLEVFNNLFMSVAEQMGMTLKRTALSTNIRERMDFSCAVFDPEGGLVANAPHIPVHLGAMAESVKAVLSAHPEHRPGDVFVTNDPALGGSHLPDITLVSPVHDAQGTLRFVCASRGHHADIGGITPGSMPPFSKHLDEEGVVLSCERIVHAGAFDRERVLSLLRSGAHPARNPQENLADLEAQIAANQLGSRLLSGLDARFGPDVVSAYMQHVQDNARDSVEAAIRALEDGEHTFEDALDDGTKICVRVRVDGARMAIDFAGTSPEHAENFNAPRAVTLAAVLYVLRCLVGKPIPLNSGCLDPIDLHIPEGSLLSPSPGRAVVAGNVETSQRVVDVLLGALGVAAASQGTMNNFTFGNTRFGYYETIAGGAGATARANGASAVHTHMTNTRITDPEVLERRFPVRLHRFAVRRGSGGSGAQRGGDGVIRELEALCPLTVSFLSERRTRAPFGLEGGQSGSPGKNLVDGQDVGARAVVQVDTSALIRIETPGGGGFGALP